MSDSNRGKRYHTIVVDPPWPYPEGFGIGRTPQGVANDGRRRPLDYSSLSLAEITSLPVAELAAENSHLYLWTTNRYLRAAFDIAEAWGWKYGQTVVWAKHPVGGVLGGAFPATLEFVLFCRRGRLPHKRRAANAWFNWPRQQGQHSRKPDAFYDLVEEVSPGPYVELFARRARFGWDYWGDESLETVELVS